MDKEPDLVVIGSGAGGLAAAHAGARPAVPPILGLDELDHRPAQHGGDRP